MGVVVVGQRNGRLYGVNASNGHWETSDNDGTTWTDTGVSPSAGNPAANVVQLVNHNSYVFALAADKIYRNAPDTWVDWTDVSVPSLPATTAARVDVLASNDTYLYYGNYGTADPGEAHVYRSPDNGANWTAVLDVPTARHVHAIAVDPNSPTHIFVTMGDSGNAGYGLYYSADSGDTWTRISSNRYGINMAFAPAVGLTPARLLMEGDGSAQPHIMGYWLGDVGTPTVTHGVTWPPATWAGTARGMLLTSEGNLFYISTSESGAVGTKDGVWMARAPLFTSPTLCEDITATTWAYGKSYQSGAYIINARYRMRRLT